MAPTTVTSVPGGQTSDASPVQRRHGTEILRGLQDVPRSTLYEGRFGRMFRNLPPCIEAEAPNTDLLRLADFMVEAKPAEGQDEDSALDNPDISAGFTYLGQFVDHDITFDPNSKLQRQNDPNALRNFRTPRFDLDSVYGAGPDDAPFLYQNDGLHFLLGKDRNGEDDLPRNTPVAGEPRRALIGDPRNDENVIVSQIHLAFLRFHNRVIDTIRGDVAPDELFDTARQIVRWHYQWVVVYDFLKTIVGQDVVDDIIRQDTYTINTAGTPHTASIPKINLKFFHWKNQPFMPVEFSVAAYRFGHSMVRPDYDLNQIVQEVPLFSPSADPSEFEDLRGFRERPPFWVIEWKRFFRFPDSGDDLQVTRKIDTLLAPPLGKLPTNIDIMRRSLALRNLLRGQALELPSGQAVARAMGIPDELILTDERLGLSGDLLPVFGNNTPLWYYILKEAEVLANGRRLGPVGGRIVAEVLIGLLAGDPLSYLNIAPGWHPTAGEFGAGGDGRFGMAELLAFSTGVAGPGGDDNPPPPPPSTGLHVGGTAFVARAGGLSLRVRATPSTSGQILGQLAPGTQVTLLEGPQAGQGHAWWRMRASDGREGWVAGENLLTQPD